MALCMDVWMHVQGVHKFSKNLGTSVSYYCAFTSVH